MPILSPTLKCKSGVSSVGTKCTKARVGNGNSQYWKIARFATDEILHSSELEVYNYMDTASPCLHSRIPQLFQDFKWPTSLKQYESCSHINLPNQCFQQMAKITKETPYGGCHSLLMSNGVKPHEYLSPSSSCRSRFFNWKFPDRFHLGRWLWSPGACLWVIWVLRHLRNQNINTEII